MSLMFILINCMLSSVTWKNSNLPGIPESFLSVFFSTSAQIEALMDELSRGRINIDAVMRLTETSKNAIEHLEKTAYLVVQNATLTEQLLQYSNRYRSFEPAVQSSFEHALKLFEVDHDYDASLEEISYALEKVEPGVTDRFVSSYEKTREQIRMQKKDSGPRSRIFFEEPYLFLG